MKSFILNLWQLPQHIIAWVILAVCATERLPYYKGRRVYLYSLKNSVSLGNYLFVSKRTANRDAAIAHEYGHSRQSLYFGWLYLIVIGLPSALIPYDGMQYYDVFCEKWANRLGGVECVSTGTRACDYELRLKK